MHLPPSTWLQAKGPATCASLSDTSITQALFLLGKAFALCTSLCARRPLHIILPYIPRTHEHGMSMPPRAQSASKSHMSGNSLQGRPLAGCDTHRSSIQHPVSSLILQDRPCWLGGYSSPRMKESHPRACQGTASRIVPHPSDSYQMPPPSLELSYAESALLAAVLASEKLVWPAALWRREDL